MYLSCGISSQPICVHHKSPPWFGPTQASLWQCDVESCPLMAMMSALVISVCVWTSVYIVLCCLCAWRRKLSLTYSLLSVTENLNFSPVYAWECYDCLLLRLKSMWQAWASLEVWLYLQGSSTLPFCPIFFSSTLCLAILTSLLSWLCAFSDLAPSQCKLAQIVENQSSGTGKTLLFFFPFCVRRWLLLVL